jgi:hypothetical protein
MVSILPFGFLKMAALMASKHLTGGWERVYRKRRHHGQAVTDADRNAQRRVDFRTFWSSKRRQISPEHVHLSPHVSPSIRKVCWSASRRFAGLQSARWNARPARIGPSKAPRCSAGRTTTPGRSSLRSLYHVRRRHDDVEMTRLLRPHSKRSTTQSGV